MEVSQVGPPLDKHQGQLQNSLDPCAASTTDSTIWAHGQSVGFGSEPRTATQFPLGDCHSAQFVLRVDSHKPLLLSGSEGGRFWGMNSGVLDEYKQDRRYLVSP